MEELDTIVIGSGAGGLSAAICLARAGQKVMVLEQHDVPGGWSHSFQLDGSRFSPGVHYIGLLGEGESTNELYKGLGVANDLVFFKMNAKAYEHCWIGEERFDFPANFDDLITALQERFPHEKKGIKKYLEMVRMVSDQLQLIPKMNGFWDNITIPWRTRYLGKYGLFTVKRVINWFVKDPLLQNILNIQSGDHGLPPGKAAFPYHSALMNHYFSGGYYPMGGGGAIVKSMTKAIKKHGGEIKTKHRVKRILLEDAEGKKRAIGVELESGEKMYAKRVLSNADPTITYSKLVGKENLSQKLNERLAKTKYSCTSLIFFLTVDMDVKAAGLDSGNIWKMPNRDMDEVFDDMMLPDLEREDHFLELFISCTTLKDPVSFDGKNHVLEVVTFINYDAFREYKDEDKQRSKAYLDFKERLIVKFLNSLEEVIPGIGNHVVSKHLGTPITNEYYINSTEGSVYGTEKTLRQIGPFSYQNTGEIENLHLCGASVMAHGVSGSSYSGVQAAAKILNCRQEDLIQPDESQVISTYDAEDSSEYPEWMLQKMEVRKRRAMDSKK